MLSEDQKKQITQEFTDHLKQRSQQPTQQGQQPQPPGQQPQQGPPAGAQAGLGIGTFQIVASEVPAIMDFVLGLLRKHGVQV